MTAPHNQHISTTELSTGYEGTVVSDKVSVTVPEGSFTVIVGPNACGKSTLLRTLARIQQPLAGSVLLDGKDIHSFRSKELAQKLGFLPQSATAPEKMLVRDLVARGRSPHQGLFRQWSREDHAAVNTAMHLTHITDLEQREVDSLSGGQRQRVWLALVLAQQTTAILLDEPTTFLDLSHQLELLELCRRLHQQEGRTVVAVLHDLNQAARYATHLIAMKDGQVVASGSPKEVITQETMNTIFGLRTEVIIDPIVGTPMVVPYPPEPSDSDQLISP